MDDARIAELCDALSRHGIEVDTYDLRLEDANDLLDRIIAAAHDAERSEDRYAPPEPVNGPVLMSFGTIPIAGNKATIYRHMKTSEAVDAFFDMLPGRRNQ